jgi:sec-independent protein translocase protein TatC
MKGELQDWGKTEKGRECKTNGRFLITIGFLKVNLLPLNDWPLSSTSSNRKSFFQRIRGKQSPERGEMSFIDHLEELRGHIIRSLLVIIVMAVLVFLKIDWVFDNIILGPIRKDFVTYTGLCNFGHFLHMGDSLCMPPVNVNLQATAFGSQFLTSITIAFCNGFYFRLPLMCFGKFGVLFVPRLHKKELAQHPVAASRLYRCFSLPAAAFGYFLLAPFTFQLSGQLQNRQYRHFGNQAHA